MGDVQWRAIIREGCDSMASDAGASRQAGGLVGLPCPRVDARLGVAYGIRPGGERGGKECDWCREVQEPEESDRTIFQSWWTARRMLRGRRDDPEVVRLETRASRTLSHPLVNMPARCARSPAQAIPERLPAHARRPGTRLAGS